MIVCGCGQFDLTQAMDIMVEFDTMENEVLDRMQLGILTKWYWSEC